MEWLYIILLLVIVIAVLVFLVSKAPPTRVSLWEDAPGDADLGLGPSENRRERGVDADRRQSERNA